MYVIIHQLLSISAASGLTDLPSVSAIGLVHTVNSRGNKAVAKPSFLCLWHSPPHPRCNLSGVGGGGGIEALCSSISSTHTHTQQSHSFVLTLVASYLKVIKNFLDVGINLEKNSQARKKAFKGT